MEVSFEQFFQFDEYTNYRLYNMKQHTRIIKSHVKGSYVSSQIFY